LDNTFFDIHMHAMDLSHPNLRSFLGRIHRLAPKLIKKTFEAPSPGKAEERIINLLTVMENNIEDFFILLEYFLKNKAPVPAPDGFISIGETKFDTILLTPLIIDFGYKDIKYDTFYNMALGKPVVEQTIDVLNAIRKYYTHEFVPKPGNRQEGTAETRTSRCLFEIYPFLGINPVNYDRGKMMDVLESCFKGYTGRRDDLRKAWEHFPGAVDEVPGGLFAGIKLYPPLRFDPWPDEKSSECKKLDELYEFCESRQIPVTAHCSDLGFTVAEDADAYTDPQKWRNVLVRHSRLKLNLAHFGDQRNRAWFIPRREWREAVIQIILSHDNVYTDISCLAFDEGFYKGLGCLLKDHDIPQDRLSQRILFGSDFMINLMWENSYNDYLHRFIKTNHIREKEKVLFCNENPARFLFH